MSGKPVASNLLSKTNKDFEREFEKLCKSYGFEMYMVIYGEPADKFSTNWRSFGYGICDGLIEMLGEVSENMQQELDKHGGCDH